MIRVPNSFRLGARRSATACCSWRAAPSRWPRGPPGRPRSRMATRQAARCLACSLADAQGMSSSRRAAGQRLTSLVRTSVISVAPRPFGLFVRSLGSTVRRVTSSARVLTMDDHSDDIRRPSQRIEVYAGAGRKRWPDDLKAQIAAESLEPGAIVTDVARRHGCRPQQVHDWRRRARLGQMVLPASADTLSFVPLVSESSLPAATESSVSPEAAVVMVELQGARVEVRGTPGLAVLSDVFLALRRTRSC
jgi:transposase